MIRMLIQGTKLYFLILLASLLLCAVGLASWSVANLQAGLEEPTAPVLSAAASRTEGRPLPKSIASYDQFDVAVTQKTSVSVYARETENASANIFMVHGADGGAWVWEYFFQHMPKEYNLYALSWRGHFDSSPAKDARAKEYVADQDAALAAIARSNDLPIHVIGHSYGGATTILQAAQSEIPISSVILLAPVVPLDYDLAQRLIVPAVAPLFISEENDADGEFGGMFLSKNRMQQYFDEYAVKNFSNEKPGLIAGDGVSPKWQKKLADAYAKVTKRDITVSMYIARYDNVVVPRRQRLTASNNDIRLTEIDSGHYIQLDVEAENIVNIIAENIRARSYPMRPGSDLKSSE